MAMTMSQKLEKYDKGTRWLKIYGNGVLPTIFVLSTLMVIVNFIMIFQINGIFSKIQSAIPSNMFIDFSNIFSSISDKTTVASIIGFVFQMIHWAFITVNMFFFRYLDKTAYNLNLGLTIFWFITNLLATIGLLYSCNLLGGMGRAFSIDTLANLSTTITVLLIIWAIVLITTFVLHISYFQKRKDLFSGEYFNNLEDAELDTDKTQLI